MANEFNTIIENSLGGLGAGRTIAAVRVVDDTGGSANASPSQLRELVGVDHSILTEQIVPGEFWVDPDGVRRQVYTRTFAGTLTITEGYHRVSLLRGATPLNIFGYVAVGHWNDPTTVPNHLIRAMRWGLYGISLEFDPSLIDKEYCVTVKYIKQ